MGSGLISLRDRNGNCLLLKLFFCSYALLTQLYAHLLHLFADLPLSKHVSNPLLLNKVIDEESEQWIILPRHCFVATIGTT